MLKESAVLTQFALGAFLRGVAALGGVVAVHSAPNRAICLWDYEGWFSV